MLPNRNKKNSQVFFWIFNWLTAWIQKFRIHGSLPSACLAAPVPGTFPPAQQQRGTPGVERCSVKRVTYNFEDGLLSLPSLLHNLSSERQTPMGHNETSTGPDLSAHLLLPCRQVENWVLLAHQAQKGGAQRPGRRRTLAQPSFEALAQAVGLQGSVCSACTFWDLLRLFRF